MFKPVYFFAEGKYLYIYVYSLLDYLEVQSEFLAMLSWIKKRCKRRAGPPSYKDLIGREVTLDGCCSSPYFELEKEDDVYEEFAFGTPHHQKEHKYDRVHDQLTICGYENVPDSNDYENVTPTSPLSTICPLCRSAIEPHTACACTNLYEEPRIDIMTSSDYAVPNDWSPPSVQSTHDIDEVTNKTESEPGVVTEALDAVYELATCPFKVPKPRRKPVTRSYSDASSRPLPKIPFSTFTLPRKRHPSHSGDDSSGYYESIGSDSGSSNGYSDITGSDIQSFNSGSDGFQDLSSQDEFDYEEFNFPSPSTPQCRRYSLGSATPSSDAKPLRKREVTLSHSEQLDKVLSVRRSSSRRANMFRSIRVRSLFKQK